MGKQVKPKTYCFLINNSKATRDVQAGNQDWVAQIFINIKCRLKL